MKKKYILSLFFALAVAGCKKNLDQSVNPNQPSVASPQNVLSGALTVTAVRTEIDYNTFGIWLGYYAPSGNFTTSTVTLNYSVTTSSLTNYFNNLYGNLANYNYLITKAGSDPTLANFGAISKIMSAYDYQMLVDNFNDVPYSQALNSNTYLFPAYDKGQAIYNALMTQLDAAIATINTSPGAVLPGSSDVIFGSNTGTEMANWKKFANTLKLRIALRQSNIAANKAGLVTELSTTSAEGYLNDVVFAQVQPGYLNSDANNGQQNPYYKQYGVTAAGALTTGNQTTRGNNFFIGLLNAKNDLRLARFYAPVGAVVVGNTLGSANTLTNTFTSPLGPGILSITGPAPIISGSDACFLLADAIVEGYIPGTVDGVAAGTAQDYYQRGITASFVALGLTAAQATTYYNQPIVDVNWTASVASTTTNPYGTRVKAILTQKYIALFGYEILESYNEYRRTGLPNLSGARSQNSGAVGNGNALQPVLNRVPYPNTEYSTNAAAVNAEPAVDIFNSTIFWALPAPYAAPYNN